MDRSRKLQDEVRRMIKDENVKILELIHSVKHLGLSYGFEKEIREALDRFLSLEKCSGTIDIDRSLHETALRFSLLREYGYDVSPGAHTYTHASFLVYKNVHYSYHIT